MDDLRVYAATWRARLRERISLRVPPGPQHDVEVERRFQAVLNTEVPSDAELIAMERNNRTEG